MTNVITTGSIRRTKVGLYQCNFLEPLKHVQELDWVAEPELSLTLIRFQQPYLAFADQLLFSSIFVI